MSTVKASRPPDIKGPVGEAWAVSCEPVTPDQTATLGSYILHAPGMHIMWDRWAVSMIHLRDLPGVRPAFLRLPGATHEIIIVALDPAHGQVDPDDMPEVWPWLFPVDLELQFIAPDDTCAKAVLANAVRLMVDGQASPDQDWRGYWRRAIPEMARISSRSVRS